MGPMRQVALYCTRGTSPNWQHVNARVRTVIENREEQSIQQKKSDGMKRINHVDVDLMWRWTLTQTECGGGSGGGARG